MDKSTKVLSVLCIMLGVLLLRAEFKPDGSGVLISTVEASGMVSQVNGQRRWIYATSSDSKTLSIYVLEYENKAGDRNQVPNLLVPRK